MKGQRKHQMAAALMGGEKGAPVKAETARARDRGYYMDRNHKEDSMLDALDMKRSLEKLMPIFQKLDRGDYDINLALGSLSGPSLKQLAMLAFGESSEKSKLDAAKHILGLAGYTPVQRHAVASVDASQSVEAIKAYILGAKSDLAEEGIEVVDDREAEDTSK